MSSVTELSSQLGPISTLLDIFNRRNRNQHRRSAWWQQFSILRRSVRKLSECNPDSNKAAVSSSESRRPRSRSRPRSVSGHEMARVQWLAETVIPRSYSAFTQLAADNQFAPLGLFLIALLAQIRLTISPFHTSLCTPCRPDAARTTDAASVPSALSRKHDHAGEDDTGIVIPRSEVEVDVVTAAVSPGPGPGLGPQQESRPKSKQRRPDQAEKAPAKKRRPKSKAGTDLGHLFGGL